MGAEGPARRSAGSARCQRVRGVACGAASSPAARCPEEARKTARGGARTYRRARRGWRAVPAPMAAGTAAASVAPVAPAAAAHRPTRRHASPEASGLRAHARAQSEPRRATRKGRGCRRYAALQAWMPKAAGSTTVEAARSSTRGSGWAPSGLTSTLGVLSRPEPPGAPRGGSAAELGHR